MFHQQGFYKITLKTNVKCYIFYATVIDLQDSNQHLNASLKNKRQNRHLNGGNKNLSDSNIH